MNSLKGPSGTAEGNDTALLMKVFPEKQTLARNRSFVSGLISLPHRGVEKRLAETIKSAERRANNFAKYADKFRVSLTLDSFRAGQTDDVIAAKVDQLCTEQLGDDQPSRVFSAKYYTKNDEPLFYLGERWADGGAPGDNFIDIEDQYYGSTPEDWEEGIKAGRK